MEPITTTIVFLYVADKFIAQFLKEEGYGGLRNLLFPKKKYKQRLVEIIDETINEFESHYPNSLGSEKAPFYYDETLFDILNKHILFKDYSNEFLIDEFKKRPTIILPEQEKLLLFYELFTKKINDDKKLKALFFDETYKDEIFKISAQLNELLGISNNILNKVSNIESQIQQLRLRFDQNLEIHKSYTIQGVDSYPKIDKITSRTLVVEGILSSFKNKQWIILHGNISIGKTQLAVLVSERFKNKFWIELKGFNPQVVFKIIFDELSTHFNNEVGSIEDLSNLVAQFPSDSILILDDLPKLTLSKQDLTLFLSLITNLQKHGVKLLSTSNFTLPQGIKEHLNDSLFEERQVPYLETQEVKEILISYGASEEDADLLKSIVCSIAEGHPTMVNAISRYLETNNWNIENEQLKQLFNGEYATSLDEEIYEKIIATVSDKDSRELLYRLKIVIGKIRDIEINTVANTKPRIDYPFEKINYLSGLWLQKIKIDSYEISPLVKKIKGNNLSPALYQAINLSLGLVILENKKLNQIEANHAINYFIKGKSYNKAGFVLSLVLEEAISNPDIFFNWGFNFFWLTTELPNEMDLFLKSVIRYLQIYILIKKNQNIDFLINDLKSIVDEASTSGINMAHAAMLLSMQLSQKDPSKANEYLIIAITHSEQLETFDKENILKEGPFNIENLVWNNLIHVKTIEEFNDWFNSFSKLTSEQKQNSLSTELNNVASLIFCSKIFDIELAKQNPEWITLISVYEQIAELALSYELYILAACAYKFQIRCYCVYIKNSIKAIEIYNNKKNIVASNKVGAFILSDELGRQLYYTGEKDSSLQYLFEAAEITVPSIYTEKIDTYLALNEILGEKDKKIAHEFILKAYGFQDKNEFVNDVFSAKVIGELAISNWEIGNKKETFYNIEQGAEKILFTYKPLADYKGTIIRYGHILNYYYHSYSDKSLPDIDGQPYMIPFRSFMTRTNDKLLQGDFYYEQRKFMLGYLMFQSFELLDDIQLAKKWAYLCFKLNDEEQINPFASLQTGMNMYLILDDRYEEAILKEIDILKSINILNNDEILSKNIQNPYLEGIIKDRPKTTFASFDNLLFEYVINFIVVRTLQKYVESKNNEIVFSFIEELKNINNYFDNKLVIEILEKAFQHLVDDEKSFNDILSLANTEIELSTQLSLLLYLIASLKSDTLKSLQLHLALISRLEMISNKLVPSKSAYKFIVIPFFESFWKIRIDNNSKDFFQHNFLISKGLTKYYDAAPLLKLKVLFRVLCHHLEYDPTENEEKWMAEK